VEDAGFADVLAGAQAGRQSACAEIWNRYAPGVAAFLRARGSGEADDLTSEVFIAVFTNLERFCGDEAAFRGYVYTIAYRRWVDQVRRRSRRPRESAWSPEQDHRQSASAEHQAAQRAGTAWARELIETLSPDQRDVLLLRVFADLTIEQIAEATGKRVGAVKALQRRGLATLRRNLAPSEEPFAGAFAGEEGP
jgi:RNA polymerase sigma-70 factor (ECF subfamily)